jgi:PIN domain nuclease of toxin-antitoxin system
VGAVTVLLDTHVLIWWLLADRRLSKAARAIVRDPANRILVSSASAWEIATKHRLGKLRGVDVLVQDVARWVAQARFVELPITMTHAQRAGSFPHEHRDPFDRMLAAQSEGEAVPIVSNDTVFATFGVRVVW